MDDLANGIASDESALLEGYFYVFDSGEKTTIGDLADIPVLKHCTKQEHYYQGCRAAWTVRAVPCFPEINGCQAMYLYHYHDHPVWMICPVVDSDGNMRGERQCIPQGGSYTHFHWITEGTTKGMDDSTRYWPSDLNDDFSVLFPFLPEDEPAVIDSPLEAALGLAIDVPDECNINMASQHTTSSLCPGFFLQITAIRPFGYDTWAFHHGAQDLVIQEYGADNKTHLNLLTSFAPEEIPQDVIDGLPEFSGGHGGTAVPLNYFFPLGKRL